MPKLNPKTKEEMVLQAAAYLKLQEKINALKASAEQIKETLKEYVHQYGDQTDAGHKIVDLPARGKIIRLKNTLRVSSTLAEGAIDTLKEAIAEGKLAVEGHEHVVESVEIIREDVLELLIENEEISPELAASLYHTKENYAFGATLMDDYENED